jgi:muconate cycloisomerase
MYVSNALRASPTSQLPRIETVEVFRVQVPFKHKFVLGSGAVGSPDQKGDVIFVKLTTDSGHVGWGEQRALPSWSYETAETIAVVIKKYLGPLLMDLSPFDVARFHQRANKTLSPSVSNGFPFARAAVDVAMHDAAGKIAGLPVHALLGGKINDELGLCSAIGVDAPDAMAARVAESSDYHAYKVKISGDVQADAAAIHTVAEVAGGKPLWLDANQSYSPSSALRLLDAVKDVPELSCLEQPVPSTDWAGMQRIRAASRLPVAIDEGSFSAEDLARTIALGATDMVVIKICKSGGLRNAMKTAAVAGANGTEILASGLTDCGIGFAASLHLFSTMKLALPAELNGPELLDSLYVEGLTITNATATVPDGHGLGVVVDEERIRFESQTD